MTANESVRRVAAGPARGEGGLRKRRGALVSAAAWTLPVAFILVPLLLFTVQSFFQVEGTDIVYRLTLKNYVRFFTDPTFYDTFGWSCLLALGVAVLTVLLGYPVAYLLASLGGRMKYVVAFIFVIPLLMSYIIKIYAIRSILGGNGFLNRILLQLGLIDEPWTFLVFNLNAVLLTLTVLLVPFAILPIFVALEKIPRNLLEASADLGASAWQTFRTIVLPLSLQGVVIGASCAFVLALGDFVTPQMVGGTSGFTFGRIIYSQFGTAFNWPFGAALSVILLLVVLLALVSAARFARPRFTA
jgi:spermidine/putrescine transport system permease protein